MNRSKSSRSYKNMPKGVSAVAMAAERIDIVKELASVRAETVKIPGFFAQCRPDDVIELVQTAQKVQKKLDSVHQSVRNPEYADVLNKHGVIQEVMRKMKTVVLKYLSLLTVNRTSLRKLSSRTRRKIEQLSSALLVEASVLSELSDDLLREKDSTYQTLPAAEEEQVEILDRDGRRMWVDLFGATKFMVDVIKFIKGLVRELNVNLTPDERKILLQVFDPSNTGQMSSLRWNEFLKAFGPLQNCLYNLQEMLAQPWFHGFLSKADSVKLLEVEPQGTYMVRFSSTKPGSFSLAHTMPGSVVNQVIIEPRQNGFAVREEAGERLFPSVSHVIEAYSTLLVHPYSQTFPRQLWWHGDISGEEASELLKGKKPGTFIIRFSATQRGCFASSFVGPDNVIEKGLIVGSPHGYNLSGKSFSSMEEIVQSLQSWNIFTDPYKNTTNEVNDEMRHKIVDEILSTEQIYIRNLDTLVNLFIREFRSYPKIRPEEVNDVFANLDQILALHRNFVPCLERVLNNWDADAALLGPHFLNLNPQLVPIYTVYVNNYNKSMTTLDRLSQKRDFKEWLYGVMAKQNQHNMLSSFLITVVQRLPRYILLLQDLIKHTSGAHADYDNLCDALDAVKRSAEQINENKKMVEDVNEVRKMCTLIQGLEQDLAILGRYIVKKGKLTPTDYKSSDYFIFFFNDLLLITKGKRNAKRYQLKEIILLDNVQIIPVPDSAVSRNQFRICTSRREITFEADSPAEKKQWISSLKKEFTQHKK